MTSKETTGKVAQPKLQNVNKLSRLALEAYGLRAADPQQILPSLSMIWQAQPSIEDGLKPVSNLFVKCMLMMSV